MPIRRVVWECQKLTSKCQFMTCRPARFWRVWAGRGKAGSCKCSCLVHLVSPIVSNHWNFTARIFPAIGKPRRSCAGDRAVDSNVSDTRSLAATVFSFQGSPDAQSILESGDVTPFSQVQQQIQQPSGRRTEGGSQRVALGMGDFDARRQRRGGDGLGLSRKRCYEHQCDQRQRQNGEGGLVSWWALGCSVPAFRGEGLLDALELGDLRRRERADGTSRPVRIRTKVERHDAALLQIGRASCRERV